VIHEHGPLLARATANHGHERRSVFMGSRVEPANREVYL